MGDTPVGLLVIRAWIEEGAQQPLRVELTLTADVERGFERQLMFAEPTAVEAFVRTWLLEVLAHGG